jgi:hypothetical protein
MAPDGTLATGAAALLFAAAFLVGGRLHPFRLLGLHRRSMISFGAGMSSAYVFVHLMPELHGVRTAFTAATSLPTRFEGMGIYFVALAGFLLCYALEHLRVRARALEAEGLAEQGHSFRLDIGGFAVYVFLMAYLLVRNLEETRRSLALYAGTISIHFLSVDHALREEHGARYELPGRWLLAAMALFGWGTGLLVDAPRDAVALVVAFVSGAVIMNSSIMELPSEKDGRFGPFLFGGLAYGLALVPLG